MNKKTISVVLSCILVAGTSYQALATPISDGQKEKIESTRTQYSELTTKINNLEAELNKLTADMNPVFLAKEENDKKIADINVQILEIEKEIPALQEQIVEKQEVLGMRMNGVYKSGGQLSYLSLLLSSDNFGDLLGNINAISTIMKLDKEVIDEIEADKKVLDDKIKTLADQKGELDKLNADNEAKIAQFKDMEAKQEILISKFNDEIKNLNIDLAVLERPLAKPLIDVINSSSSSKDQIDTAIESLKGLKNQIVSPTVNDEIAVAIEKGRQKSQELSAPPVVNNEVSLDNSTNSNNGTSNGGTSNQENNNSGSSQVAPPASGSVVDTIIAAAYQQVGKAYVLGATGPDAFDCSSLMQHAYRQAGVSISRTTYTQVNEGRYVPRDQLQRGDLVFTEGSASSPTHVGLYIGNGQMIHAARPGVGVVVAPVYKYVTARRIL